MERVGRRESGIPVGLMFCKFVVELVGANDCVMGEKRSKNGANENKAWCDECVFFMLEDVER